MTFPDPADASADPDIRDVALRIELGDRVVNSLMAQRTRIWWRWVLDPRRIALYHRR